MSSPQSTLARCLAFSVLASVGFCMPSARSNAIQERTGCPAGPHGPNYQTLVEGDTCQTLAEKFNTSTLGIALINSAGFSCTKNFIAGTQVCIPPPCNAYTVQSGDTCQKIVDDKKVAGGVAGFYSYNPGINNPSCNNLLLGYNVCLSPYSGSTYSSNQSLKPSSSHKNSPQPTARSGTAIPSGIHCTKTYTAVTGDTCGAIAAKYNLMQGTDNYFYSLNPTVHNPACNNINIGQVYCVANATTAAFPKSDTDSIKCTKQYEAKAGDICITIASDNGLPDAAAFQALNPTVNAQCTNLVIGMKYCVQGTNSSAHAAAAAGAAGAARPAAAQDLAA